MHKRRMERAVAWKGVFKTGERFDATVLAKRTSLRCRSHAMTFVQVACPRIARHLLQLTLVHCAAWKLAHRSLEHTCQAAAGHLLQQQDHYKLKQDH